MKIIKRPNGPAVTGVVSAKRAIKTVRPIKLTVATVRGNITVTIT